MDINDFSDSQVVLCDDDITNVMILTKLAEVEGVKHIQGFSDPRKVLPFIQERGGDIDLLILDLEMPYMSGFDVLKSIGQEVPDHTFPILIITGHQEKEMRHRALQEGANDFLVKPFDPVEVTLRIRNLLNVNNALKIQTRYAKELELQVQHRTEELSKANDMLVHILALAGEMRDGETGKHVARVGRYSRILAEGAGLPPDLCYMIERAAPLHDVGKIGIPDGILLKQGRLIESERKIMDSHTTKGLELLGEYASDSLLLQMAASIALHHHEKWNGTGYPRQIKGESIPIEGRIASISDVFDALTTLRPYKEPWSVERAVEYLQEEAGKSFDPNLVHIFIDKMDQVKAIRKELMDDVSVLHH